MVKYNFTPSLYTRPLQQATRLRPWIQRSSLRNMSPIQYLYQLRTCGYKILYDISRLGKNVTSDNANFCQNRPAAVGSD